MWDSDISKHKLKQDAIPTIFGFFLKQQILTKAIANDGNTENNILTQSNKCTNEANNNIENEKVTIATVSIKRERKNIIM